MYFKHGIDILLGKYDSKDDPGQITHFEALSSALAGTVGMGNIALVWQSLFIQEDLERFSGCGLPQY